MQNIIVVILVALIVLIPVLVMYKVEKYQPHLKVGHHRHPARHWRRRHMRRPIVIKPRHHYWWNLLQHHCNWCDRCRIFKDCDLNTQMASCANCPFTQGL
jgi:hypothetical protein